MQAYRAGIFPMADSRDDAEVFWVEPRWRAILPLDGLVCSRSLARTLRRGKFTVTCNTAFAQVLEACAAPRRPSRDEPAHDGQPGTWISHRIADSYGELHALGHAHSIECWAGEGDARQLVGGLYGVGFDRVFCGESMFSRQTDASKVALCWLVAALRLGGVQLLDCQFITGHLASLGAIEITQSDYLRRLALAQYPENQPVGLSAGDGDGSGAGAALSLPAAFGALLAGAKSSGFSSSPGNFIAQSFTHTS
jgi:leucyl/phenylalanyl-tRNA--protein transferase